MACQRQSLVVMLLQASGLPDIPREVDFYRRAFRTLRIDFDMSTGLLHEPIDLTESQPRPLSDAFCREKRIKGFLGNVGRHTASIGGY